MLFFYNSILINYPLFSVKFGFIQGLVLQALLFSKVGQALPPNLAGYNTCLVLVSVPPPQFYYNYSIHSKDQQYNL